MRFGKIGNISSLLENTQKIVTILAVTITTIFATCNHEIIREIIQKNNLSKYPCEIRIYYIENDKNIAEGLEKYLNKNERFVSNCGLVPQTSVENWKNTIRYFNKDDKKLAQSIQFQLTDYLKDNNIKRNILTLDFSNNLPVIKNRNPSNVQATEVCALRDGYIEIWLNGNN